MVFKKSTSNGSRQLHSSEHEQSPSTPEQTEQTSFNLVDETSCVSVIRNSLRKFNISGKAVDIILSSWRESTKRQYWSYIKKWLLFCGRKQNNVLEYLLELYGNTLGYSSINTVRSALSALLSLGYKDSLGEHPLIKRFMKGVFNQRPALPRYQHIWDVNIVLEYLASLSPVNVLSFYTLTLNFITLLCLLSGQRVQTLQQICLEDCAVTDGVLRIKHSNFKDHKTRKSRR
jgi:hypothetical protein